LKLNYIGIVAAIIALASLALPWWTASATTGFDAETVSLSLYPWGVSYSAAGYVGAAGFVAEWWMYTALAFVVIGAVLGLVGSVMVEGRGKKLLLFDGILMILSIIIWIVGFLTTPGGSTYLFYSAPGYSTSLYLGWGLALVAAIIAFVARLMQPTAVPTTKSS